MGNSSILGGRLILATEQPVIGNSRYITVQVHKDKYNYLIIHEFRTVRYRNILIVLSTSAMLPHHKICLQDITQACIQGQDLQHEVYRKEADQVKLPQHTYLKLLKPVYGLSESRRSWFHVYKDILKMKLNLQTPDLDIFLHC